MFTRGTQVQIVKITPQDDYACGSVVAMEAFQATELRVHGHLVGLNGKIIHVDDVPGFPYVVGYRGGRVRVRPTEIEPLQKWPWTI